MHTYLIKLYTQQAKTFFVILKLTKPYPPLLEHPGFILLDLIKQNVYIILWQL